MKRSAVLVPVVVLGVVAVGLSACTGEDSRGVTGTSTGATSTDAGSTGVASTATRRSTGASSPGTAAGSASQVRGEAQDVRVRGTVASGIDVPWGIAFDRTGGAFIAERETGRVLHVVPGQAPSAAGEVLGVRAEGEGGLLGLAYVPSGEGVPAAPQDRLYAYFSSDQDDNRIVRMDVAGPPSAPSLGRPTDVLTGITWASNHDGGRIVFGPDGHLWVGTGDAGDGDNAQDKDSLNGKILRLTLDGEAAEGNPFGNRAWSYGHRNVQGLAFDSAGRLWASEFGQNTWDELNLVEKGGNYGWPLAEGDDGPATANGVRLIKPKAVWTTDEASPSGLAIVDDVAYMAGLRGRRLWQIPLREDGVGEPRALFDGEYGRLRTVEATGDGGLWLTTSNRDGRGSPGNADDRVLNLSLR